MLEQAAKLLGGFAASVFGLWFYGQAALKVAQSATPSLQESDAASRAEPATPPVAAPAAAAPAGERPADVVSYVIRARLDSQTHKITASEVVTWTNASRKPAEKLWFHLYLNAFKNDKTLFLRSPFGAGRSGDRATDWGYIDVKKLWVKELGVDIWPRAAPHSPGDPDDETDIMVPLPAPVDPGGTLTLHIDFEAKLPKIVERTGYSDSFHFVAQWFPKLARREPDGTWAHFPFHAQGEFYADFGKYDVTLDVDRRFEVAASGRRVEEHVKGNRRIVRHELEPAHDFAWAAWDQFQEQRARIEGVDVRILYPPTHEANAEDSLNALRFALPYYGRLYGRYPYPVLTVVHPPEPAENAGGMEYPTLITTGGSWFWGYLPARTIAAVTVHELAHQWFYGLVASNEHAFPFLDEGLTSYAESDALQAQFGNASALGLPGLHVDIISLQRAFAASRAQDEAIALSAPEFASFRSLAALVYSRTTTILETFERVYGREALRKALGRYAVRYRFRHPTPEDFIGVVREALGADAADNLHQALFERGFVDFLVRDVQSTKRSGAGGIFDRDSGRKTLQRPRPSETEWVSRVVVHRRGSLKFPVEVELVLGDGGRILKHWHGRDASIALSHEGPSPIVAAVVDPERRIVLDQNLLNNAAASEGRGALRTLERAVYGAQILAGAVGP